MSDIKNFESLGNAIILQAVKDYRMALKVVKKNPDNRDACATVREVERFFRSAWYEALTDVDGNFLIRKLRQEAGV